MSPVDEAGETETAGAAASSGPAEVVYPYVYTLLYPVEIKGADGAVIKTVTSITIKRRAKGKDLLVTDRAQGDVAKSFLLLTALTGELPILFSEMDKADIAELGELVGGS